MHDSSYFFVRLIGASPPHKYQFLIGKMGNQLIGEWYFWLRNQFVMGETFLMHFPKHPNQLIWLSIF
jgi:hypothetical protein